MTIHTKDGGVWKAATPYLKKTGTWQEPTQVWTKDSGIWKQVYQKDVTPPPVPALSLDFIANRYLNVNVTPNTVADPSLAKVRVLVSATAFPANPFSSGFVSEPDVTFPDETWSDFLYNVTGGHSVTGTTTKEWPTNPGSTRALTGGTTYYFSAFAQDMNGNWSAGNYKSFKAPDRTGVDPVPPVQSIKTVEIPALWSACYNGDDSLRWAGVNLYQGLWNAVNGAQESVVGFDRFKIVNALRGASVINKVEIYMYSRAAYNPAPGFLARYGFHDATAMPASIATLNRFGVLQNNIFHSADGHWIDITSMSTSVWKNGTATGMFFQPNTFDRHYSGLFDGHTQTHPPKLRFTFTA
jgi:hypothetical protein